MSYSAPYIDEEGIHVPTYDDIMEHLQEQYKTIFGLDSYLSPEMQDYQLMSIYAKTMEDTMAMLVEVYNSRNPAYATGASLDMILSMSGMKRRKATQSSAILTLTGTAGVIVPAGSKVVDDTGYLWSTQSDCLLELIPSDDDTSTAGRGRVLAKCDTAGAIDAPANTITSMYSTVIGWSGVDNENDAEIGLDNESDEEARLRRLLTLSRAGSGTTDALISSLYNINGVMYADIVINDTDDPVTDSAVPPNTLIPPHSMFPVVYGGVNCETDNVFKNAVAETIWKGKAPGIGTAGGPAAQGGTTVPYTDAYGHVYNISFCIPKPLDVNVTVVLEAYANYDADRVEAIIRQAIQKEITSLGVGKSWSVTTAYRDIYNAFADEECPFAITSVKGQVTGGSEQSAKVVCPFNRFLAPGTITITAVT